MKIEYNNLYIHFVYTTARRLPTIKEIHRIRIEKYITGIVKNHKSRLYAIYANPEHLHLLVSKAPDISEDELAKIIADSSAFFINENNLCSHVFAWQQSGTAFSVSKSDVEKICNYILKQPKHHKKHTFEEEYQEYIILYQQTINPEKTT